MTFREDFVPYFDGNGLLAPNPIAPGTLSGSGNGVMYTSEYYIMLKKLGFITDQDIVDFIQKINQCISSELLNRVPVGQGSSQEGPDDYLGTLNACKELSITSIPRQFLWAAVKYKGALNNPNPWTWSWSSFLVRQPQLLACMMASAFPSWKNPLHILFRTLCLPLFLYSSVAIGISCMSADISDSDSRRLAWHVQNNLKPVSLMCWLASKIWLARLYRDYRPTGMQAVASIYYSPHPNNPYSKWWVTE